MDLIPYVPTPVEKIATILSFAAIQPGDLAADLGAGDGRLVIAMAEAGANVVGFEIQKKYARRAKANIQYAGLATQAVINQADFWVEDLAKYDVIVIYAMAAVMQMLSLKLSNEMKRGSRVIINGFPLPDWKSEQEHDHLYLYTK